MKSLLLPLLTALVIGVLAGMLAMWDGAGNPSQGAFSENQQDATDSSEAITLSPVEPRMQKLEQELQQLKKRLSELENGLQKDEASNTETTSNESPDDEEKNANPLNQQNLVNAGVSAELAAEILRRLDEQEYQRLELRDRAIREGYFRSKRYYHEMRQLKDNELSLRDEIGDDAYDRYLYESGQNNRIAVSSVMTGSPADQSGLKEGDIVLRYNNQNIFAWNEIRQATSKGQLGEYVTVDILRNGEPMSLMMPRGPMGVKLQTTRVAPLGSP